MPSEKNIIVVGSTNTDMVVMTNCFPSPGETILGGNFFMNLGGKGANQAVGAARLGAPVAFASRVGQDVFGREAIALLQKENIDISLISMDAEASSGVALITVDKKGENSIVVAPGANANLVFEDVAPFEALISSDSVVLMQLEIPIQTIEQVCSYAKSKGATVVLNPAPAQQLPEAVLAALDIITPNQKEAELLSGIAVKDIPSAQEAAQRLHELGPDIVVITMGSKGAYVSSPEESFFFPAFKVHAVDTTAAGDIFNGALVVGLSRGETLREAVAFATKASAVSVTRIGAQASAPTLDDIATFDFQN